MNNTFCFLFLTLLSLSYAIIYVAPTGSSTADGTFNNPISGLVNATIYANSQNDLTLVLLNGTYNLDVTLSLYSKPGWNITSYYGSSTTTINLGTSTNSLFDLAANEGLSISKITFINGKFTVFKSSIAGVSLSIKNCVFRNVLFSSNLYGAIVTTATDITFTFDNNLVIGCKTPTLLLVGGNPVITNNKFIQNNDGTAFYAISFKNSATKTLTLDNNIFSENYGVLDVKSANVSFANNKVYSNNGQTLSCTSTSFSSTSNTVFCGNNGNTFTNCAVYSSSSTDTKLKAFDGCKVCNGYNENKDCTGTCWGTTTSCSATRKWYVSTTGTGSGNYSNPLGSIQTAINSASYGDTIVLFPGTYSIAVSLNITGKGITITKDISGEIYNTIIAPAAGVNAFLFASYESYDTKISYITISGSTASTGAITIQDASPTIDNVVFTGSTGPSMYIRDNCFSTISNSQILNSAITIASAPIDIRSITAGSVSHTYMYNNRFESNSGTYGSIYQVITGSLTLTSNIFKYHTGFVVNVGNNIVLNAYSNAFTNNTGTVITCPTGATVNQSSNLFCGGSSASCNTWGSFNIGVSDGCGVCGGNNSSKDCSGTCFGYKTLDTSLQLCCLNSLKDCGGYCNNTYRNDKFSTCCSATSIDCENICYQGKINDTHGGCCYSNQTDCAGYCFGTRQKDNTLPTPLCCYTNQTDCGGYCNGTRIKDNTLPTPLCCFTNQTDCGGYCNGTRIKDNTTPTPLCCFSNQTDCGGYCNGTRIKDSSFPTQKCCFSNQTDCANICNGTSIYDDYSTCCESTRIDCSETCNGTNVVDKYGQCCSPLVKDCLNECWGGRKNDTKGKCCYPSSMDCSGECFGLKIKDSNGDCCLPTLLDCNNTCNGNSVFDNSLPSKCCKSSDLDCDRICLGGKTNDTLGDCCLPNLIDCEGICNGTKVWDLSLPKMCCEELNVDCAGFCNGNNKKDSNGMCCDSSLIVCGKCGGSEPCTNNGTSTSSTSSSSTSASGTTSGAGSTTATANGSTTTTTDTSSANGIGGNGEEKAKSANGTSFGTREILYVVFAVLWVLVIVAVVAVICIIRKRRN